MQKSSIFGPSSSFTVSESEETMKAERDCLPKIKNSQRTRSSNKRLHKLIFYIRVYMQSIQEKVLLETRNEKPSVIARKKHNLISVIFDPKIKIK